MDVLRSILPDAESVAPGRNAGVPDSESADRTCRTHVTFQQYRGYAQDVAYVVKAIRSVVRRK